MSCARSALELRGACAAIETCRPLLDERRPRARRALPDAPLWVDGDPARLAQVVRQPAQQRGEVHRPPAGTSASTRDARRRGRGSGARQRRRHRAEMLPRIFDLFTQGDRRSSARRAGSASASRWCGAWSRCTAARVEAHSDGRGPGQRVRRAAAGRRRRRAACRRGPRPAPRRVAKRRAPRILVVDDNRDAANSAGDAARDRPGTRRNRLRRARGAGRGRGSGPTSSPRPRHAAA